MVDYILEQFQATPELIYLVYIGIALGAFLTFTGVMQMLSRGENKNEARNRRMRMIAEGKSAEEVLAILKPNVATSSFSWLPLIGDLPKTLRKAGITSSPSLFLGICCILAAIIFFAGYFLAGLIPAFLLASIVGLLSPIIILKQKVKMHERKLVGQLPDALDLIARGLRVGHPLNTSIQEVAQQMSDPIASEFGIIFDQISLGEELVDAFQIFAERVDLEDVSYLSASVGIQHGTGGDLARIIQVLSQTVRGRIAMRQRVKAISAEGRLTGIFLSGLPFFILGSMSLMNPNYYLGVIGEPMFLPMAIIVAFLVTANAIAIMKLVNFRI